MTTLLLKQIAECTAHLRKLEGKLVMSCPDDTIDQHVFIAQCKTADALKHMEQAFKLMLDK